MKTHEELCGMTMKQLKEYAREIGCCLGYDGSRKASTVEAIEAYQRCNGKENPNDKVRVPIKCLACKKRASESTYVVQFDGWFLCDECIEICHEEIVRRKAEEGDAE